MDIFLANTSEDYAERLEKQGLDGVQAAHEMDLSNRAILYGGGKKTVVLPTLADEAWLNQTRSSLGYSDLTVLVPKSTSLRLCRAVEQDHDLLSKLKFTLQTDPNSRLIPYAVTEEYCSLCRALGLRDASQSYRAAINIDSKAEFREAFRKTEMQMPPGHICEDLQTVVEKLFKFAQRSVPAVLKVHDGESGWGMEIFNWPSDLANSSRQKIEGVVVKIFASDWVWSNGPYIVEQYILPIADALASPSGEATVTRNGVQLDYVCDQVIGMDGSFIGIRMGRSVEGLPLTALVAQHTEHVGRRLHDMGYEGSFDVDFIVGDEGLYALESNVRRTGGTHVFEAARHCFGSEWTSRSFISNDCISYGDSPMTGEELFQKLRDILFDMHRGSGVIVSYVSSHRPVIGAIGIGKSDEEAIGLIEQISQRLKS